MTAIGATSPFGRAPAKGRSPPFRDVWPAALKRQLWGQEPPRVRLLHAVPHPNVPVGHPQHARQRRSRFGPVPHQRLGPAPVSSATSVVGKTPQTLIISLYAFRGFLAVQRSAFGRQLVTRPRIGYTLDKFCYREPFCALPELHGRKRSAEALLRKVRYAAALALRSLWFRERAHREVLRWLRQADWGGRSSRTGSPCRSRR